jgi:hypothetical protein
VNSDDYGKAWSNVSDFERGKSCINGEQRELFTDVFGPQDAAKVKN